MTRAEEAALRAYPPTFSSGKKDAKRIQAESVDTHQPMRTLFIRAYEQAEKDLAQDFHADTLIGDKDYAVFHADVEELNGDLYNYCQEQGFTGKVKVIIVEND